MGRIGRHLFITGGCRGVLLFKNFILEREYRVCESDATMAKLPKTIYDREINYVASKGEHAMPMGLMIRAFKEEGYGQEKATKWVKEMADLRSHDIRDGIIYF